MSCLMLNHEGFSKSWKLSNSTRQSSCRDGEKYGEAAVKLLAATLGDQWVLADKRMHINNNWWRRIRRLVKKFICKALNLLLCNCFTGTRASEANES
uniref:Uncharacterized protein n=1 Tax=Oryza barthii TaxID=65489 RepID=A0A0D3GV29_9ORYZ